jgi:heptosyltransferase III
MRGFSYTVVGFHRRLLIRPGAIGDVIVSLPELESARADYTEVWAPRVTLPLIRFADRTRAIIDTGIELVGVVEGVRVQALASFDSIYCWYGTNRPEFREAVRDLPFTFFPALPIERRGIPRVSVPKAPVADFAVIHPFSGSAKKNWPMENFHAVLRELQMPVEWSAGPEEKLDGATRFDDLYELACWIATARVYIGNDSGISHLAAAVGTPVVAIFISTDPEIWAPRGERVMVLRNPTVREVIEAARRICR